MKVKNSNGNNVEVHPLGDTKATGSKGGTALGTAVDVASGIGGGLVGSFLGGIGSLVFGLGALATGHYSKWKFLKAMGIGMILSMGNRRNKDGLPVETQSPDGKFNPKTQMQNGVNRSKTFLENLKGKFDVAQYFPKTAAPATGTDPTLSTGGEVSGFAGVDAEFNALDMVEQSLVKQALEFDQKRKASSNIDTFEPDEVDFTEF